MPKTWEVAGVAPRDHMKRFPALSPLLVQVLYNRGITSTEDVEAFVARRWTEPDIHLLPDIARATDVLIRAIQRRDRVAVYGDFDADGVTATALLVHTLTALGADVLPYIPKRVDEGYGLNLGALRKLYGSGVRLVVTVDCGIRAVQEIEQARRGLEFIVTDHHSVGPELPFALAVVNPKRGDSEYLFRDLSGVGVAFKVAQALIREARRVGMPVHIEEGALLDLVAIGTVADLVPLVGENRRLVHQGLDVVRSARREGVRALLRAAGVRPAEVSATDIAFGLGPRLNAAGRLGDASLSYDLLVCGDPGKADRLADRLNAQNRQRRALTEQAYERAEDLALARGADSRLLFAADETFAAGVVGLVAGRLTEAHYRPAVVVERGEHESTGSCRSIKEFHITAALDECSDILLRHGGHAAAAGFTVRNEDLEALADRLLAIAERELDGVELGPTVSIDAEVQLSEMDWAAVEWLDQLEPCGYGNPTPLFLSRNVPVAEATAVGADGKHLKLSLGAPPAVRDAIAFRMGERIGEVGERLDVVYHLGVNTWNGERRLQLNVRDLRSCSA